MMTLEDDAREAGVRFGESGDAVRRVRYWIRWEGKTHVWSGVLRGDVARLSLDGREREVPLNKFRGSFQALQFHIVRRAFEIALSRYVPMARKRRESRVRSPRDGLSFYVKKDAGVVLIVSAQGVARFSGRITPAGAFVVGRLTGSRGAALADADRMAKKLVKDGFALSKAPAGLRGQLSWRVRW